MFTAQAPPTAPTGEPSALTPEEHAELADAATADWSLVDPRLFGAIFQACLDSTSRHTRGVHYTAEPEIQRVIQPTIVRPWLARIAAASTPDELLALHAALLRYRVLDPACGTGNFLYVAYRELAALERHLLARLDDEHTVRISPAVGPHQCLGIDIDPTAVALARLVLTVAAGHPDPADLEATIVSADALFCAWPPADAIVGNPPFQSKNKAQQALGAAYMARLRARYPEVPGRADYCVYWFRRAHDELRPGARAGLVGTNTIRENDSRRGALDPIVQTGTITEAVSSMVWPGDAAVHVSIVNWVKNSTPDDSTKILWTQASDTPTPTLRRHELPRIHASLSPTVDLTTAHDLPCNTIFKYCFQGQTPGHRAFIVDAATAATWPRSEQIVHPYLTGDDLLDHPDASPSRLIIDLGPTTLEAARRHHPAPLAHLETHVRPAREQAAARESSRNADLPPTSRVNRHHQQFLARWWLPSFRREDLLLALRPLPRYIACSRVTRRPIFDFVSSHIRPSDSLQVFIFDDDYSFAILQSPPHTLWFNYRCSHLKLDPRYTSTSIFNSFVWPQQPSDSAIHAVAAAGVKLRETRRALSREHDIGLRALYRALENLDPPILDPQPEPRHRSTEPLDPTRRGAHTEPLDTRPLRDAHAELDAAVRAAYGMPPAADPLAFLLELNTHLASLPPDAVQGPGWPTRATTTSKIVSSDCVTTQRHADHR